MTAVREELSQVAENALSDYPGLVRKLLFYRGIIDADSARAFLDPEYSAHTHDPFLMKDMERAVERVLGAITQKEKIVIYSDYDADGVPGGVVLRDFFKKIGFENVTNYIPHRHDEGFGLNHEAIEQFGKEGVGLLITVDCGIADKEEIALARTLKIDTIVTDHHEPSDGGVPDAFAVLDPKQKECNYPFKELCGSGVAYKLVQGLVARGKFGFPEGWEKWLLDMVGLATLSDMVPLVGENRVFAKYGLLVLRKSPRPGLQKLLRRAGVNQRFLTEDDVSFSISPKLNAASRLGSADVAFKLLSTDDEDEADEASRELERLNNERKGIVGSLVREIKKIVAERYIEPDIIVIGNPSWRPALLGLAAQTISRERACPVFLWGRDGDGVLKGSCRSDGRTNVMELMSVATKAFEEFGGHAFSGGFTVSQEKVHTLEEMLARAKQKVVSTPALDSDAMVDMRLSPEEVTSDLYTLISRLAPFGQGNEKPVFFFDGVRVQSAKLFGKERNHLEVLLTRRGATPLKAIRFFAEPPVLPRHDAPISFTASLERSTFAGRVELRLRIIAIL